MLHLLAVHTFSKDAILLVVVPGGMAFARRAKTLGMASRLTSNIVPQNSHSMVSSQVKFTLSYLCKHFKQLRERIRPFGCEPTEHLDYSN